MLNYMRFSLAFFLITSMAFAVAALDPEVVYDRFHKATQSGDFESLVRYGTQQSGDQLAAMPEAMREGIISMIAMTTPVEYTVVDKIATDAGVTLIMTAENGNRHGKVMLVIEGSEWRVDHVEWPGGGEVTINFEDSGDVSVTQDTATQQPTFEGSVQGRINGSDFVVEKVELGSSLVLRQGSDFFADKKIEIFLMGAATKLRSEGQIVVSPQEFMAPHIHISQMKEGQQIPETKIYMNGYSMTLTLDGNVGNIDLRLPEESNTYVSGSFVLPSSD